MTLVTQRLNVHQACRAVRRIVEQIHSGELPAPALHPQTPSWAVRWTPSFIKSTKPDSLQARPYTVRAVAEHLNANAEVIELVLALLELQEQKFIAPSALRRMADNGLSLNSFRQLVKELGK